MQQPPPFGFGYEPPRDSGSRPVVILFYRAYAAMTVVMYVLGVAFFGLRQFIAPLHARATGMPPIIVATFFAVGLVILLFGAFFAVAAMVPFKPWGWTVGLVAICLGLSSCLVVFSVPLLIYWMKPETKAAFGRL
jgi:hypothetical protein